MSHQGRLVLPMHALANCAESSAVHTRLDDTATSGGVNQCDTSVTLGPE